eukprot:TRINITY_DN3142_c0_g1_i2.p2 TRINITY_DN3142_c0_g1~~TRINITY_DN3142_c0_g1_i2.p2  ORF type:complete len:110 (+),score=16.34 TRINITY_DN3142_c0_g1_i2:504-833(+)
MCVAIERRMSRSWHGWDPALLHRIDVLSVLFMYKLIRKPETVLCLQEAKLADVPSIGIIDTDQDPDCVTYPIPGNDDTADAVQLYAELFAKAVNVGKEHYFNSERSDEI